MILCGETDLAPTAINCQERAFIVVTNAAKIAELRAALTKNIRSLLKMVRLAASKPAALFLPAETQQYMRHLQADFEVALRHLDDGDDYIFHNAPCLIFFAGVAKDPAGKDHALGAQHYLMVYAETLGLGTCINGYAQSAPKLLAKHLDIPKGLHPLWRAHAWLSQAHLSETCVQKTGIHRVL